MSVDQIDVSGFRGVKEFEEPLELLEFTILVGRNNAGKSSISEALYAVFCGGRPNHGETKGCSCSAYTRF